MCRSDGQSTETVGIPAYLVLKKPVGSFDPAFLSVTGIRGGRRVGSFHMLPWPASRLTIIALIGSFLARQWLVIRLESCL